MEQAVPSVQKRELQQTMPPLPGDNLRKILPSDFSIIYVLKSEYFKCVNLLLFICFISCLPYWILCGIYLKDTDYFIDNDLSYAWIYLRSFWSTCFLVALYHPIFHIRPSNLACLSIIIFLIFDGFDTLFAYYYLHVDVDSKGDRIINSFIIYESNKHICNIFNCTFLNTYHFVLFVITFPLMNLFGLILSIIYLKCLTVYGNSDSLVINMWYAFCARMNLYTFYLSSSKVHLKEIHHILNIHHKH